MGPPALPYPGVICYTVSKISKIGTAKRTGSDSQKGNTPHYTRGEMKMVNAQSTLATALGLVVTFFVPAVVWASLGTSLLQVVSDRVRRLSMAVRDSRRLVQEAAH